MNPKPQIYHFSNDGNITVFEPRPVRVPSRRSEGMEWLNGPLVWAIEEDFAFMYLFPRDCPRILMWPTPETTIQDRKHWLVDPAARAVAFIEQNWIVAIRSVTMFRYSLPNGSFENLHDAGMWVSGSTVSPINCFAQSDLFGALKSSGVTIFAVESLVPLKSAWSTSLHVSGIRLRNAKGW